VAVDDYLDADNAVRTEEALLDEEIVRGLMHANEEYETEPEDAPIVVVDYAAAYKAFTTLSQCTICTRFLSGAVHNTAPNNTAGVNTANHNPA
jgi:hypothetical protein